MVHIDHEIDTIVALATGKGNSALAIIRISGTDGISLFSQCILEKKRLITAEANTIHVYTFFNDKTKKQIDEITAIKYLAPKSFTGENMIEIICHGGEIIIDDILSNLIEKGIRFAKKGEFTRRAFLNGKMDFLKPNP